MTGNSTHKARQALWRFADVLAQLTGDQRFVEVGKFADDLSVELYRPSGKDLQSPHTRDELYIIATGNGTFTLEEDAFPFEAGDLIFVPAQAEHRFASFSDDFSTWVIFFGPENSSAD